jgi:hypothetical protein
MEAGNSQSKAGQAMKCACGTLAVNGHKNLCSCTPGRQPDTHFRCTYRLKAELTGPHFSVVTIFDHRDNGLAHQAEQITQKRYKMAESLKNDFDQSVLRLGTTAGQFAQGTVAGGLRSLLVAGFSSTLPTTAAERDKKDESVPFSKQLMDKTTTKQLNSRATFLKEQQRREAIGATVMPSSDFHTAELLVQTFHLSVLAFMRADPEDKRHFPQHGMVVVCISVNVALSGRPYLICMADQSLLRLMRKRGLVGMDVKWDFTIYRLPVAVLTFTDDCGRGCIGAICVLSVQNHEALATFLQVVQYNVPCASSVCLHPKELRQFQSGMGW